MSTSPLAARPLLRVILVLASMQGLALWYLTTQVRETHWPALHPGSYSALLALAVFLVPCAYALAEWWSTRRTILSLALLALLLALVGFHHGRMLDVLREHDSLDPPLLIVHFLAMFVLVFHLLPFLQSMLSGARLWLKGG